MKLLCIAAVATMACLAAGQADPAKGHVLWQFETGG
jgi:hypothetical protein